MYECLAQSVSYHGRVRMTKSFLRDNWPLILALGVLWAGLAVFIALCVDASAGRLVYPLDDPYIHMAMAKNFAGHGVWGVTSHEFSFSSSSPLWTALLSAVYFVFGPVVWAPLVLNVIAASLLCVMLHLLLRRIGAGPRVAAATLIAIIFLTPLIVLAASGLEHLLQCGLAILFVYLVAEHLMKSDAESGGWWAVLTVAALVALIRYEGLFLLFVALLLLVLHRKWLRAVELLLAGLLPISLLGLLGMSQGWGFFPNSILLKGNLPIFSSLTAFLHFSLSWARGLLENPHLLVLAALLLLLGLARARRGRFFEDRTNVMIVLTLGTLLMHLQFARTGWLFRYEAYLVALGLFVIACALAEPGCLGLDRPIFKRLAVALAAGVLVFGSIRAVAAHRLLPRSVENIYQQQIQTALFLRRYYQGQSIALNDIGAPNFYCDIKCLDLWGLASREVGALKLAGDYHTRSIARLARQKSVTIAIVYEKWFANKSIGGLPPGWILAGRTVIPGNQVCGDDTLSFFALDPAGARKLSANLRDFAPRLPAAVELRYTGT